jgi:NADH:ubiquinone oxidoreductase subunit F (NADH-binding)
MTTTVDGSNRGQAHRSHAVPHRKPARQDGWRRLLGNESANSLDAHLRKHGQIPWQGGMGRLIRTVEDSGLTGHGGAGFPTWRKLAAVAAGERAIVVANGAEGEPASAKDRTLLTLAPHLVLDGLQLVAETVSAERAYLYTTAQALGPLKAALSQRSAHQWDRTKVELVEAPHTFISGQESAVIARIEGQPALPRDNRRLVVESGLRGAPTLVQNVETLAHLALLARRGAAWFRALGTHEEPGTFLATLSGAVAVPGVYEAPYGVPLAQLLDLAGGPATPLQAVLIGGYHGVWLPAAADLPVSRTGLRPHGGSPGAGVVVALSRSQCGLVESAKITNYLADQTAGQCGPCMNGLPRMADTLAELARGSLSPNLPAQVERLAALVTGRGACHHPDGTARLVRSTLQTFAGEVRLHLTGRCTGHGA